MCSVCHITLQYEGCVSFCISGTFLVGGHAADSILIYRNWNSFCALQHITNTTLIKSAPTLNSFENILKYHLISLSYT